MPQSRSVSVSPHESQAILTPEEVKKHRGRWLAFTPDGSRLIAGCQRLDELDAKVRAAGEDPQEVLLDWIPEGDAIISGSELS